jgi:hypothetical protein
MGYAFMRFLINLRTLIVAVVFSFAYITTLTFGAQYGHWTFATYTLLALCGVLLCVVSLYTLRQRWDLVDLPFFGLSSFQIPRRHIWYISGIAVLFGLTAVAVVRPNPDDYYYFANAFYAYQNPQDPLTYTVKGLMPLTEPFISARWAVSGPYEYFVAAVASTLPIHFLSVAHIVFPFFNGVFYAIVLYYAIVTLYGNFRYAIHGFVVAALLLFVLGDSQYGPLHYSLLRFTQGKAVFLACGIPLFLVESYVLLRSPRLRNTIILSTILIASVGLTTSGYLLVLLMNCVVVVALITFVTYARLQHPHWILLWINDSARRLVLYLVSAIPVLLYALWLRLPDARTPTSDSLPNKYWPTDFFGHAVLFYNPRFPFTLVVLAVCFVGALFVLKPRLRALTLVFFFVLAIGYLNPSVAPSVILYITQANTYWRVFYLAVPMVFIGIVAAGASRALRYRLPRWRSFITTTALLCYMALLTDAPSSIFRQPQQLSIKRVHTYGIEQALWKVTLAEYQVAQRVIALAPPGPVLAPERIAGSLILSSTAYPQLAIRSEAELYWGYLEQNLKQMTARVQTAAFLDGQLQNKLYVLETELTTEHQRIRTLVLRKTVYARPEVRELLDAYGFSAVGTSGQYVIVVH